VEDSDTVTNNTRLFFSEHLAHRIFPALPTGPCHCIYNINIDSPRLRQLHFLFVPLSTPLGVSLPPTSLNRNLISTAYGLYLVKPFALEDARFEHIAHFYCIDCPIFFRSKRCEIFLVYFSENFHRFPVFELTLQTQQIHKNTVNSKYNSKHSKWSWMSHRSFIHHSSIIYDVSNNWKAVAPAPNLRSTRRMATDPNRPVDVLLGDLAMNVKQDRGPRQASF